MKSKFLKPLTAGLAGVMTVVIVATGVMNNTLQTKAADTFLGIQQLINDVKDNYETNQEKYRILEIVPDYDAAQIGFLFDQYEPILSEWNQEEQRWMGWRERLSNCENMTERAALVNDLKAELGLYYEQAGLNGNNVPVSYSNEPYDEKDVPTEGYEKITYEDVEKNGWFVKMDAEGDGYHVVFDYRGTKGGINAVDGVLYYKVAESTQVQNIENLANFGHQAVYQVDADGIYSYLKPADELLEELLAEEPIVIPSETETTTEEETTTTEEETTTTEEETTTTEEGTTEEETTPEETTPEESTPEESTPEESTPEESTPEESTPEASTPENEEGNAVGVVEINTVAENVSVEETLVEETTTEDVSVEETTAEEESSVSETETESESETEVVEVPGVTTFATVNLINCFVVEFEAVDFNSIQDDNEKVYEAISNEKDSTKGEYRFVEWQEGDTHPYQLYILAGGAFYCKNTFKNNEWFKKYTINMEEEEYNDFPVEVITMTPEALDTLGVANIPDFDFLYIGDGAETGVSYEAANCDLSTDISVALYKKVVEGALPTIVNGNILFTRTTEGSYAANNASASMNIFRLCAVLAQENPAEYLNDYANVAVADLINSYMEMDGAVNGNYAVDYVYVNSMEPSIINSDYFNATIYQDGNDSPVGFQKVLDEINLENLYREADGNTNALPLDISQALVVRHILNYNNRRVTEAKSHINVLEIQPAKTEIPDITLEQLKRWAPDVKTFSVDVMTTAEFIGNIETLNDQYDLIYIGTSKDHMNIDSSGQTTFNDESMNGLIYYHTGDKRYANIALAGMLDSEYRNKGQNQLYYVNSFRYNGNDISEEKMEALYSFLNGSYPIVVSDDFITPAAVTYLEYDFKGTAVDLHVGRYTYAELVSLGAIKENKDGTINSTSTMYVKPGYRVIGYYEDNFQGDYALVTTNEQGYTGNFGRSDDKFRSIEVISDGPSVKEINANHIDNCSYLYEFASTVLEEKRTNFYAFSDIDDDSELFKFYLNRPKATLVDTKANGDLKDNVYYLQPKGRNTYELEYEFKIQNNAAASANTKYQCNLYIDVNADGKFSDLEKLDDIDIYGNGKPYANNELTADVNYTLYRRLPEGYKGVLPWKVEVTQVGNENVYCYMDGYTKLEGLEKEVLNILQICRNPWNGERMLSLAEEINGKKSIYNYDTGEVYSDDTEKIEDYEDQIYYKLIYGGTIDGVEYEGISDDFEIDVDFMSIKTFDQRFARNEINLDDYNMLILGFADMYGDFSTESLDAIVEYMDSGKSVLLAHDTTSFVNCPPGSYGVARDGSNARGYSDAHYAYELNKRVRDLVGMDQFGVTIEVNDSVDNNVLRKGNALTANTGAWNEVASFGNEMAYEPKSNRQKTVPEVHGYTYYVMNRYGGDGWYSAADTGLPNAWRNEEKNIRYDTVHFTDTVSNPWGNIQEHGAVNNLIVTKANDGQITQYPYVLSDEFEVSRTHDQYYTLDFTADDDEDGQTDLVVWYCLGGRKNGNGQYQETIYSMSPNDMRNNYYIYSKGNITYTGMGHSGEAAAYSLDEAKLFINTMVASYKVGLKPPVITALERGEEDSPEKTVLYRAFDTIIGEEGVLTETDLDTSIGENEFEKANEKIYFTVKDINLVKGTRDISVKFYYEDETEGPQTISYGGEPVRVFEVPNREARVYDVKTNALMDPDKLVSGGIYYVWIPKNVLLNCENGMGLYFAAQSTVTSNKGKNVVTTGTSYDEIQVLKIPLYDLE